MSECNVDHAKRSSAKINLILKTKYCMIDDGVGREEKDDVFALISSKLLRGDSSHSSSTNNSSSLVSQGHPSYSWKQIHCTTVLDELKSMCRQERTSYQYLFGDDRNTRRKYSKISINTAAASEKERMHGNMHQMEMMNTKERKNIVDASCREKIVEWCYRVIDYFGLQRDNVYFAMSYLDRFMSVHGADRHIYKLAATTALLLAVKIHQPKQINLKDKIKDLCNGQFDNNDVMRMELIMLRSLLWKMYPPSPTDYILRLMSLNPFASTRIQEFDVDRVNTLAIYFVELSLWDKSLGMERQYVVAISAILNAMEYLGIIYLHDSRGQHYYGTGFGNKRSIVDFVEMMFKVLDLKNNGDLITTVRDRLRKLYERSHEYENTAKICQHEKYQDASYYHSIRRLSNKDIIRFRIKGGNHANNLSCDEVNKKGSSPKSIV